MKPISPGLLALLTSATQLLEAELFTIALNNGSSYYFTDIDIPLTISGTTYLANSVRFEGLKLKLEVGWQVDEQDLRIDALPGDTVGTATFFPGLIQGLLDGAYIMRSRAFWPVVTGMPSADFLAVPTGVCPVFIGRVSTITRIGRTSVEMKLKSPMSLLDMDMPRNSYSPGCLWTLFDTGCTLTRASFTNSFTVSTSTTQQITPTTAVSPSTGGDGLPYYQQGRLLFTSGDLDDLQVLISTNDGTKFTLQYPLVLAPTAGDTFAASAGCVKTSVTCNDKFSNVLNFHGFPRIPPIFVSL